MVEEVEKLINVGFEEIKTSSELTKSLLRCYSILYLGGKQPNGLCLNSQKRYHQQIKKNGIMKAKNLDKKTCVCKKKGIMYASLTLKKHINLEEITDRDALALIKDGTLKKEDFSVLPEMPKQAKKENK